MRHAVVYDLRIVELALPGDNANLVASAHEGVVVFKGGGIDAIVLHDNDREVVVRRLLQKRGYAPVQHINMVFARDHDVDTRMLPGELVAATIHERSGGILNFDVDAPPGEMAL